MRKVYFMHCGAAWVVLASEGKIGMIPEMLLSSGLAAGGLGSIVRSREFCTLSLGCGWLILHDVGTLLLCRLYGSFVWGSGSSVQKRVELAKASKKPISCCNTRLHNQILDKSTEIHLVIAPDLATVSSRSNQLCCYSSNCH